MREIIISSNESGQRLDKFLAKYMDQATKSFFYKMMRKKNIVLNGKKCQGNEQLTVGDSVKLFLAEDTIEKFSTNVIQRTNTKLDIIYEDNDVIFINKPVGMLSQKADKNDESLVEHVITHSLDSGELQEEDLKSFRPSVCNRLDRNTSGLITAGKSLLGLQILSKYFQERTMEKYYLTIVIGQVKKEEHLKGYLLKDERTNKVEVINIDTVKNYAPFDKEKYDIIETSYKPLASNGNITLLEVHLITGKTHQIRAHLSSIGHGILGDSKYNNTESSKKYAQKYKLKNQLLHAYKLVIPKELGELQSLSGKTFLAKVPCKFSQVASEIGGANEYLEF